MAVKRSGAIEEYLGAIERDLGSGQATEHTHRPALERLSEKLGGVKAINEPKRSACGAPDFSVSRPTGLGPMTLGYSARFSLGRVSDWVAALPDGRVIDWRADGVPSRFVKRRLKAPRG